MSLSSDTDNIAILIEIFNSIYDTTDKGFEVKPDLESEALINWSTYRNKIKNNWVFVSNKLDPLIKNAEDKLKKHDSHLSKYNKVKKAQEEKDLFTKFTNEYNSMKNNLVELPDFKGKTKDEVETWSKTNNIKINISEVWTDTDDNKDKVINQSPKSPYTKIIKNSTLNVEINKGDFFIMKKYFLIATTVLAVGAATVTPSDVNPLGNLFVSTVKADEQTLSANANYYIVLPNDHEEFNNYKGTVEKLVIKKTENTPALYYVRLKFNIKLSFRSNN